MEYILEKNAVGVLTRALDSVSEQPVDIDFTLPDYCPDIEKILRCKITPKIYNRNLSGGQLQIDGTTVVNILYTDNKDNIRACEQSIPFNTSFSVKEVPDNYVIETEVKCEYLNYRPLSQRRITVHGAFSLYAKVYTKGSVELYSPNEESNLEYNTEEITLCALSSLCQEQFSAWDEIQVVNKPPVEIILDSDVNAVLTEFKTLPDKMMFNGELNIRILYQSNADNTKIEHLDYTVPFSKIVDCGGLNDNTKVNVSLSLLSYDIRLKNDILSENPIVNIDSRLSATVTGYNCETVTVITDAYSTEFQTELEKLSVKISESADILRDSFMYKSSVDVAESDIAEIIDFNVKYSLNGAEISDDKVTLGSKLVVSILAYNSENEPLYIERALEFDKEIDASGNNTVGSASAEILSVSYRIAENGTVELRCEIVYDIILEKNNTLTLVTSVTADEDKKIDKRSSALVLYYAENGESLWDIAKRFNTGKNLIIEENSLDSDEINNSEMLLIPMV